MGNNVEKEKRREECGSSWREKGRNCFGLLAE